MGEQGQKKTVGAVETSIQILEALRQLEGAGVTELSNHIGKSKTTVYNHLTTLRNEELVAKEDEEYDMSFRFLDLAHYAENRLSIMSIVREQADILAEKSGEIARFTVEEHGKGICLYIANGEQAVQTPIHKGQRSYLHSHAGGKAILAFILKEDVEQIIADHGLEPSTPKTITDKDELFDELEEIRNRGYAINREQEIPGLTGISAPFRKGAPFERGGGPIVGSLSIIAPDSRMPKKRLENELREMLFESTNYIKVHTSAM